MHNTDFKAIEGMTLLTNGLFLSDLLLDYYVYSVVTKWLDG